MRAVTAVAAAAANPARQFPIHSPEGQGYFQPRAFPRIPLASGELSTKASAIPGFKLISSI